MPAGIRRSVPSLHLESVVVTKKRQRAAPEPKILSRPETWHFLQRVPFPQHRVLKSPDVTHCVLLFCQLMSLIVQDKIPTVG